MKGYAMLWRMGPTVYMCKSASTGLWKGNNISDVFRLTSRRGWNRKDARFNFVSDSCLEASAAPGRGIWPQ